MVINGDVHRFRVSSMDKDQFIRESYAESKFLQYSGGGSRPHTPYSAGAASPVSQLPSECNSLCGSSHTFPRKHVMLNGGGGGRESSPITVITRHAKSEDDSFYAPLSHSIEQPPANRCRILTLIGMLLLVLILLCLGIVLFSFKAFESANICQGSQLLCSLPGQKQTSSGIEPDTSLSKLLPADPGKPWGGVTLPDALKPLDYDLFLRIDADSDYFTGNVTLKFTVEAFTSFIILNCGDQLRVVDEGGSGGYAVSSSNQRILSSPVSRVSGGAERCVWRMARQLTLGETYFFSLSFSGPVQTGEKTGLYRTHFTDSFTHTRSVYLLNSFPAFARRVLPCFDEPRFTPSLKLTVQTPVELQALANGARGSPITWGVNTIWRFHRVPTLPTYQFTLALFPALTSRTFVDQTANPTQQVVAVNESLRVRAFYRPQDLLALGNGILDSSLITFRYLNSVSNLSSAVNDIPKLDFLFFSGAPAGGIIGKGLVVLHEQEPQMLSFFVSRAAASQVVFERTALADWRDFWVIQGLASFIGYQVLTGRLPRSERTAFELSYSKAMFTMLEEGSETQVFPSIRSDKAVSSQALHQIMTEGVLLRMMKAGSVFVMLSVWEKPTGLLAYSTGQMTTSELLDILQTRLAGPGRDLHLDGMLQPWLHLSGYPVITLEPSAAASETWTFSQQTATRGVKLRTDSQLWQFPLAIVWDSAAGDTVNFWIDKTRDDRIPIKGRYAIAEAPSRSGWYLTTYKGDLFRAIQAQLDADFTSISEVRRYSLIYSNFILCKLNGFEVANMLDLVTYARNETSPVVLQLIGDVTAFLLRAFDARFVHFLRRFFGDIWEAQYERNCKTSKKFYDHSKCDHVIVKWACYFDVSVCRQTAEFPVDELVQQFVYVTDFDSASSKMKSLRSGSWVEQQMESSHEEIMLGAASASNQMWRRLYDVFLSLGSDSLRYSRETLLRGLARNYVDESSLVFLLDSLESAEYTEREMLIILEGVIEYPDGLLLFQERITQLIATQPSFLISLSGTAEFCQFVARYAGSITLSVDLDNLRRLVSLLAASCPVPSERTEAQIFWYTSNEMSTQQFFYDFYSP